MKLKQQYHNFSAVLFSGAMAIFYFITFAANNYYELIPVIPDFTVLVIITAATVGAAIWYRRQVIAHIGLVGAYAVPFLLDDGSGKVMIFFSYVALINCGILVISIRQYWKPLLYSSFIITWLVFLQWYFLSFTGSDQLAMALSFALIYFLIFYIIHIGYKIIKNELFAVSDIWLIMANSAIFYGLGYAMLSRTEGGGDFLGLFTFGNAIIQTIFWSIVFIKKRSDENLVAFIGGLALVFATIAIPVQLDGRWVTLLWAGEGLLLLWLGRSRQNPVYEWLSYPVIFMAFCSLVSDWTMVYGQYSVENPENWLRPFVNINLLSSLLVATSLGLITWLCHNGRFTTSLTGKEVLIRVLDVAIPVMFIAVLYFAFLLEITNTFGQLFTDSRINTSSDPLVKRFACNYDIMNFSMISVFSYSMIFFSLLSFINIRRIRSTVTGMPNMIINLVFLALFLTFGLIAIGGLRDSYLDLSGEHFFHAGIWNILVRYIGFTCAGIMLYAISTYVRSGILRIDFSTQFDILFHIVLLTIISNELINWMDLSRAGHSYKLALSILFGVYSLGLIILGIMKRKKHLRLCAMVLFGGTLLKLFFYDLTDLDTISKTIVFLSLGILLLIISFLYNKYTRSIFEENNDKQ